jgi:hypothetical protein
VYGYNIAFGIAGVRSAWWVISVAMRQEVSLPEAVVYSQIALLASIMIVALVTERLLLPEARWTDMRPKTDAAGRLLFDE